MCAKLNLLEFMAFVEVEEVEMLQLKLNIYEITIIYMLLFDCTKQTRNESMNSAWKTREDLTTQKKS